MASTTSIFPPEVSVPPNDTVFFSIYPDFLHSSLIPTTLTNQLHFLHDRILETLTPYTSKHIWQHQPFSLIPILAPDPLPHLTGELRYGDNLEDEWFMVYLLFQVSKEHPDLTIQISNTDGEFLLIETAFHVPDWVNPETSTNRVFIRRGFLHIIPDSIIPDTPLLRDSLSLLSKDINCRAPDGVQNQLESRLSEYPNKAYNNVHKVRVRVPVGVAKVLKHEPSLISRVVEGLYDRDIDTMKYAGKMERFLGDKGSVEELVRVMVRMSRAMYAQLMQKTFQAPKCYPSFPSDVEGYREAELGMKIACGLEMMIYQLDKSQDMEGRGSRWDALMQSVERSRHFEGWLPESFMYKRLMLNIKLYYDDYSLHARKSGMLSAPVERIDEILALP